MNTTPGAGPRTTPTVTLTLTEDQILMLARLLQRQQGTPGPELAELMTVLYHEADQIALANLAERRNRRTEATLPGFDK
jgi:hypothetical protein